MAILCAASVLAGGSATRAALSPKSPEVRALITGALPVIEAGTDTRVGAKALAGLTLLKAEVQPSHPRVQNALEAVHAAAGSVSELKSLDVYTVALAVIFLVELDPQKNKADIEIYLNQLVALQKGHGGWGYPNSQEGDTSMTQYGVLALWEADNADFATPSAAWDKAAGWLIRTQDPSGAWGYHGNDPGNYNLVAQGQIRHSMVSAGLGSLYICADHFGFRRGTGPAATQDPSIPQALQRVRKAETAAAPPPRKSAQTTVDLTRLGQALDRGEQWMRSQYTIKPGEYPHYFLYAFERYESFRELSNMPPFSPSQWYEEGVAHLSTTRASDGSWISSHPAEIDTAFALLFLLRSSRKSIERVHHLGPGTLVTGRGLPEGMDVELRMGQVRPKPLAGPAEQLLAAIEDPGHPDYLRAVEGLEEKVNATPPAALGKLAGKLRELAGGDDVEARAAALRALGRTRNIDNVPVILAALSDPDDDVFLAAEDAMKFLTRTLRDPASNEGITPNRRANAVRKWTTWYRALRPTASLED